MWTNYNSIANTLLNTDYVREQQQQQQQTSRSSYQLYRYNHEPISTSLLPRDIPPIVILLFFLFLIVIVLLQILVVHKSRYGSNYSTMQKIQEELRQMDESMETILRHNVLPIDKWRLLFHIRTYVSHFQYLFYLFNKQNYTRMNDIKSNSSDNQKKRIYCNEEPSQLRMFKINKKYFSFCFFL
jgi:hypothetical protein